MTNSKQAVAQTFDRHVAHKLRLARDQQGFTQVELAGAVGVSFQQIQKYENGTVRVSAGRLMQLSKALQVPVSFFYADLRIEDDGRADEVIVDLTGLTVTKATAVKRLVNASESDAETIEALLARLQQTYN